MVNFKLSAEEERYYTKYLQEKKIELKEVESELDNVVLKDRLEKKIKDLRDDIRTLEIHLQRFCPLTKEQCILHKCVLWEIPECEEEGELGHCLFVTGMGGK